MWIFRYLKSMGKNFGKVSDRLYRGAKPSESDYKKFKEIGITSVINLIDDVQAKEAWLADKQGLEFFHYLMSDNEEPDKEVVRAFIKLIRENPNKVFFVHCKGGRHRTSLMVAVYRVVFHKWSKEIAWDESRDFGWYGALGHEPLKEWFFNKFKPEDYR
jgi:protein tyrosine/serine phosphatase